MQIWAGPKGPCPVCSLREAARLTLKPSSKRTFTTSSNLHRKRVIERIIKGRWKESILSPAGLEERRARLAEKSFRHSRHRGSDGPYRKVLHLEESGQPVAEQELQTLKKILQDGKLPDGSISSYGEIDPELKHFESFEAKVKQCFEQSRAKGEKDKAERLRVSLVQSFMQNGRTGIRKSLQFAYLDHVVESSEGAGINVAVPKHFDLRHPTEWFPIARRQQREIHLHVGPTNSGKTYHALKRLEKAGNGLYAGPLRLLAYEVYSRFRNKGVPCDLITGDDIRLSEGGAARFSCHTVEMVDCSRIVDVAVIDEIQMIAHEDRGWAWTRALLGTSALELHLCGETRVVPLIRELAASMGDNLHIHHYDRLNPLKAMKRSLKGNLRSLSRGDCVVSFSVLSIHAMKKQIELETGRRVAIVYGSLPPEIRAQQAALFNEPGNDYDFLVASDAIGMGLNLSIKRVVFETLSKYDGARQIQLSVSQIKQIAGRAGRYRTANQEDKVGEDGSKVIDSQDSRESSFKGTVKQSNVGLVTCLDEEDLGTIQTALDTEPDPIKAAGLQPPVEYVSAFAQILPAGTPVEYVLQRLADKALLHPRYFLCDLLEQRNVASCLASIRGLDVPAQCTFAAAPVDVRSDMGRKICKSLARCVADRKASRIVDIPQIPLEALDHQPSGDRQYLLELEILHKSLILFTWLSYRFTNIFIDREMALHAKDMVEEKINTTLLEFSANPRLRAKLLSMRQAAAARVASDLSPGHLQEEDSQKLTTSAGEGLAEEDLTDSLSGAAALPVDWEKRPSIERPNAENSGKPDLPAAANPQP